VTPRPRLRAVLFGEQRLRLLESMLAPETVVVGVNEHTATLFNLDAELAVVARAIHGRQSRPSSTPLSSCGSRRANKARGHSPTRCVIGSPQPGSRCATLPRVLCGCSQGISAVVRPRGRGSAGGRLAGPHRGIGR